MVRLTGERTYADGPDAGESSASSAATGFDAYRWLLDGRLIRVTGQRPRAARPQSPLLLR